MDSSQDDHDLDRMIENSISRSNNSNNTRAGRLSAQLEPHQSNIDPSSPIYGFDATTSVNSPLAHLALQPGMSPAIQRGTSLGLALGGSGFRKKALFGPEEEDEEEGELLGEEGLDSKRVSGSRNGKSRKTTRKGSKTFQTLTRSADEEDDQDVDRIDGVDEDEDDDDDEEDADSETPLQPQEPIRGLE